jgi:ATP-dependent Clp protease ATP-binding subunit ClpB
MIRLDMSEYMEKNASARMIGAPPGYIGYEEGGQLTEAVRKKPYSVILFDEIEKAHVDVFNLFLQILEDGRLTDSKGRTVDFRNAIIICTSNVGTELIQSNVNAPDIKKRILDALLQHFRPEFVNRFDEVVVYKPLRPEDMVKITSLMLAGVGKMLKEQGVNFQATPAAQQLLAEIGYDPAYGARPLRRAIQDRIENPIANYIISGALKSGDTALVDVDASKNFAFRRLAEQKISDRGSMVSGQPENPPNTDNRTPNTNSPSAAAPFAPPKQDDDKLAPPPETNDQTMSVSS